ncbi:MAG TPA: hypothetical protein VFB38_01845 [Chthonomonadaceae bacterium]|nr:hypothetical protein [Chthonomonadaceae bacterium]
MFSFGPRPHTFEVVADPNAPNDPTHIQVQTRFVNYPAIQGYSSPDILWDLRGTYDPTTGNLSVSGAKTGTVFFNDGTGQDPFHLFPFPTAIFIQLVNPTFSLQGKVVAEPGGLEIIGTDAKPSFGSPGNITADFSRVIFTSALASEPNSGNTLLALDLVPGTGFGAFYNWRALAVPEPGALSLLACLGISSLGLAARRLRRR